MIAYRGIFTLIIGLGLGIVAYGQGGTIKVEKKDFKAEMYGLQGNTFGSPQSFIILIDDTKAVFVNSYNDANYVWDRLKYGEDIDGKVIPGQYKLNQQSIFIYLTRGIYFNGSKIDDALFLRDNTGLEVVFYRIYK